MTKILILRHRPVQGFFPERFRGRADLPLADEGYRQAEATACAALAPTHEVILRELYRQMARDHAHQERPKATSTEPVITAA